MDKSGVIHGPPLPHQPASLFMLTSNPRRWASPQTCLNKPSHAGLPNLIGPFGAPWSTSMMTTPPIPARCIASKSAVMPLLETLPASQNQNTQGRAEGGGCRKFCSRAGLALAEYGRAIDAARTAAKRIGLKYLEMV